VDCYERQFVWWSHWVTGVGESTQKIVTPFPSGFVADDEKVRPSAFLLVDVRNGIRPL